MERHSTETRLSAGKAFFYVLLHRFYLEGDVASQGLSAAWPVLPDPGELGLGMAMLRRTPVCEGTCAEHDRFDIHGFNNHSPDSSSTDGSTI